MSTGFSVLCGAMMVQLQGDSFHVSWLNGHAFLCEFSSASPEP